MKLISAPLVTHLCSQSLRQDTLVIFNSKQCRMHAQNVPQHIACSIKYPLLKHTYVDKAWKARAPLSPTGYISGFACQTLAQKMQEEEKSSSTCQTAPSRGKTCSLKEFCAPNWRTKQAWYLDSL